jgi:MinD superfamily P-loop ATPase
VFSLLNIHPYRSFLCVLILIRLKGTDWGDLDVLVLDLPPGTGDVQLAVCQDLELSGAVAVTTPSKLAATDARKGIEMFTSLGVPTLAAVENMSYFTVCFLLLLLELLCVCAFCIRR